MSHASIQDKKIYKQIVYHDRNDRLQGIYDPTARRLKVQDIVDLYVKQGGKCYWSGVTMTLPDVGTSIFQVSIDRVDSSKGHTLNNIVLTCLGTNLARNCHSTEDLLSFLYEVKLNFDETRPETSLQASKN